MKFLEITEAKDPKLNLATHEFDVNGYSYYTDIDDDGDVRKIWHYAQTPNGDVVDIDYTPYDYMDRATFSAWIEKGMPGRSGLGPLRKADLVEAEATTAQKLLAEIGRTLMDKAVTTKDDALSAAMSRLGNELTGYGEVGYAKNTKELARKTGLNAATISKLVDYGHAVLKKEGPVRVGGKSDPAYHDEVEERKLTGGEKRSKEAQFKKLKKARGDFEKRYGKDAESVMHAVATKQAKAKSKNEGIDELIRTGNAKADAEAAERKKVKEGACAVCDGTGQLDSDTPCQQCGGRGHFSENLAAKPQDRVQVRDPKTGKDHSVDKKQALKLIRKGYQVVSVDHMEEGEANQQIQAGARVLAALERIVDNSQAEKVKLQDGRVLVDLFTASAIEQVYNAVNDSNKDKILNILGTKAGLRKIADFAMQQLAESAHADHDQFLREWGGDDQYQAIENFVDQAADVFQEKLEQRQDQLRARAEAHDMLKGELSDLGVTHGDQESKQAHAMLEKELVKIMNRFDYMKEETVKYADQYDTQTTIEIDDDQFLYNGRPIAAYNWNSAAKDILTPGMHKRAQSWDEVHAYLKRYLGNPKGLQSACRQVFNMNDEGCRVNETVMVSEAQFDEAAGKKDACYHKVKSRYKVWPSAYASGALVKCRKVGASNWGNKSKK